MPLTGDVDRALDEAAAALADADGLLVAAGAGMGVDSGLPDFRGNQGFWRAYPPYQKLGVSFVDMANPQHFADDPAFAWGFYGHRRNLYRETMPHDGFAGLQQLAGRMPAGAAVFTSNVDGQFQKAGFADTLVAECHGSIHVEQCLRGCGAGLFAAPTQTLVVETSTMRAQGWLPTCPGCGEVSRPNILMFGDWGWDDTLVRKQEARVSSWLQAVERLVVVELGAGTAIPSVRFFAEDVARRGGVLVRVNPREAQVPSWGRCVSVPLGAQEAVAALVARM